jgi:phospholipase/carboxylesterase
LEVTEHLGTLAYLTIEPEDFDRERPYPMVVMLHGKGVHMGDLAPLCAEIDTRSFVYALPNAPVTLAHGGFAWVDPHEGGPGGMRETEEPLMAFLAEVGDRYEVEPGRTVLGGFSQGGMMTLRLGLADPGAFLGLFALSASAPDLGVLRARLPERRDQPIFMSHGAQDAMVPIKEGRETREFLESQGYAPEYHEYQMGHQITQAVVEDLARWLHTVTRSAGAQGPQA